ncbi:hypothetical protein [Microbacterium sp.]|uniref:hypothetical protein n=1 Tax=Microbacterium sp. TaxID=51671 RepID=UPI003A872F20
MTEGTPLVTVTDAAMTLRAVVSPAQVLRLAGRTPIEVNAQLDGSSGPFGCDLRDPRPTDADGEYSLLCAIPEDVPAVVGLSGLVAIRLDERADVLALPIEAVAGTVTHGSVYPEGSERPTPVELGITDGAYVEIVSGLADGDVVRIPSPSLLRQQQ